MPALSLLARAGLALVLILGGTLAAIGGVSLGLGGIVAVVATAVLAACVGAGFVRESAGPPSRRATLAAAARTATGAVVVLLVLTGSVVAAGGAVTALLAGCVAGALLTRWALRSARRRRPGPIAPVVPLRGADGVWVRGLSVQALGQEWLRTSAELPRARDPLARQELVRRRQEALDELERRDPAGFARWLAGGATVDSDPAEHVAEQPSAGADEDPAAA